MPTVYQHFYVALINAVDPTPPAAGTDGSPFAGIKPLFDIFGSAFDSWWKKLFGGLLAGLLIYTGAKLAVAIAGMHKATDSGVAGQVDAAKNKAAWAAGAFGGVVCFVPLTVAFFTAIS